MRKPAYTSPQELAQRLEDVENGQGTLDASEVTSVFELAVRRAMKTVSESHDRTVEAARRLARLGEV
jgi:hypothetical protein